MGVAVERRKRVPFVLVVRCGLLGKRRGTESGVALLCWKL